MERYSGVGLKYNNKKVYLNNDIRIVIFGGLVVFDGTGLVVDFDESGPVGSDVHEVVFTDEEGETDDGGLVENGAEGLIVTFVLVGLLGAFVD